ncbi:hypothetical protein [Streptomyces litchfieldiae]|uniref:Uncharacterized protein n=1 Tax=Streptomyces litchfieldiae TaxID=3075543 RepID=A0ABU2N0V2_9ACTN|nr:hypothetical protein [Streptomyces sp. DSM 44938]MDT0347531.1 hypothetical protein [Streptomyces sp. DSM 44938]
MSRRTLARWSHSLRRALGSRPRTAPAAVPQSASSYVPPADRPAEWAADAAGLHAAGRPLPEIAAALCVDQGTAARLVRSGQLALADERLQELLGDRAAAWLDHQVSRRVDADRLDPDTALAAIAHAVLADDALVLAAPGQTWTLRPDRATASGLPKSVTITARSSDPPRVSLRYDDGRQEDDVDPSLLTQYYWLAAWDREDQEVP